MYFYLKNCNLIIDLIKSTYFFKAFVLFLQTNMCLKLHTAFYQGAMLAILLGYHTQILRIKKCTVFLFAVI